MMFRTTVGVLRRGKGIEMSILLSSMRNSSREHAGTHECHQVRTLVRIGRRGRRYRAGGTRQSGPQRASRSGPRVIVRLSPKGWGKEYPRDGPRDIYLFSNVIVHPAAFSSERGVKLGIIDVSCARPDRRDTASRTPSAS